MCSHRFRFLFIKTILFTIHIFTYVSAFWRTVQLDTFGISLRIEKFKWIFLFWLSLLRDAVWLWRRYDIDNLDFYRRQCVFIAHIERKIFGVCTRRATYERANDQLSAIRSVIGVNSDDTSWALSECISAQNRKSNDLFSLFFFLDVVVLEIIGMFARHLRIKLALSVMRWKPGNWGGHIPTNLFKLTIALPWFSFQLLNAAAERRKELTFPLNKSSPGASAPMNAMAQAEHFISFRFYRKIIFVFMTFVYVFLLTKWRSPCGGWLIAHCTYDILHTQ